MPCCSNGHVNAQEKEEGGGRREEEGGGTREEAGVQEFGVLRLDEEVSMQVFLHG